MKNKSRENRIVTTVPDFSQATVLLETGECVSEERERKERETKQKTKEKGEMRLFISSPY